jgi:hypothetical protein
MIIRYSVHLARHLVPIGSVPELINAITARQGGGDWRRLDASRGDVPTLLFDSNWQTRT